MPLDVTPIASALSTLMGTPIDDSTATLVVESIAGNAGADLTADPNVVLAAATGATRLWLQDQCTTWQQKVALQSITAPSLGG